MILEGRPSISKKPAAALSRNPTTGSSLTLSDPPPYSAGSHSQIHHTQLNHPLPPVPEREGSYSGLPSASSSRFVAPLSAKTADAGPSEYAAPAPTVNQVHLSAKNEDIIGTFYIDPRNAIVKKRKKSAKQPVLPHASFRSRAGTIQLALGTAGIAKENPSASVQVASGTGNIEINLLPIADQKPRLALDAQTRQGDVCVHIPESFSGMIQLNTRKGEIQVLPALMQRVKVLKATGKETILVMGASQVAPISADVYLTDLCQITTTTGRAIVGLAGLDKRTEKEGFWQKLGSFFRGD
ncbi:hypothetical protein BKA70DRAFT_1254355 [Coprinopsis sp. MPI-PUGE-AT-0042]|nr:hypothetical protein BKA70DRAFT_1254355 [Coprinopsis sp. MPI-PUGE-AT-0042]